MNKNDRDKNQKAVITLFQKRLKTLNTLIQDLTQKVLDNQVETKAADLFRAMKIEMDLSNDITRMIEFGEERDLKNDLTRAQTEYIKKRLEGLGVENNDNEEIDFSPQ